MFFNLRNVSKWILSATAISLVIACPVFGATVARVNGENIIVREGSNVETTALGLLSNQQEVTVLGSQDGFVNIDFQGNNAYVSGEFIVFESAEGIVNTDNVEVKANGGDMVVANLNTGTTLTLTGKTGDMLLTEYNGSSVFIHKDAVDCDFEANLKDVQPEALPVTYAVVKCDTVLNLREAPSTSSKILTRLPNGTMLDIVEDNAEWLKVKTSSNQIGHVNKEFIVITSGVKPPTPDPVTYSAKGEEIVAFAKQYLGTPYVYGGTKLGSGVDCSGFLYSVYKNFGITLNRTSSSMPANGTRISKSELVAGDLIFFSNNGAKNIQHVGMYCGDGTFIHAASGKQMRVMINGLDESYYVTNYLFAARVLKD